MKIILRKFSLKIQFFHIILPFKNKVDSSFVHPLNSVDNLQRWFFLPATKSKGFQVLYSSFFVYYMRYLPTSINHNIFLKKKLYSQITQRITLPDACLLFDITLLQQRKYELGFYKHLM